MALFKKLSTLLFTVWLSLAVSGFSLGLWVYHRRGSPLEYSLVSFFTLVPSLLFTPVAGIFTDRWGPQRVLKLSHALALIPLTLLWFLFHFQWPLPLPLLYGLQGFISGSMAFALSAYSVCSTYWVTPQETAKANGLFQMCQNGPAFMAPLLSGPLYQIFGPGPLLLLAITTLFLSLIYLQTLPLHGQKSVPVRTISWRENILYGFHYITQRPHLRALTLFNGGIHFFLGMVGVLAVPYLLAVTTPKVMGLSLFMSSLGMVVGGPFATSSSSDEILKYTLAMAIILLGAIGQVPASFFTLGAFGLFFCLAQIDLRIYSLWQNLVPLDLQGRVFAYRRVLTLLPTPIAYVVGGKLAENVFIPWMKGTRQGLSVLFLSAGILLLLSALSFWPTFSRSLHRKSVP